MTNWLARSTKWFPMMKRIAREEGMPEEILALAMNESALDLNQVSKKMLSVYGNLCPTE